MTKHSSIITAWFLSRDKKLTRLESVARHGCKEHPVKIPDLFAKFEEIKVITPSAFTLYRGPRIKNPDRLLLFAAREEEDIHSTAHLSLMTYQDISERGEVIFTKLPWLSDYDTGRFYQKMQTESEDSLRTGRYNWIKGEPHPLLDKTAREFLSGIVS